MAKKEKNVQIISGIISNIKHGTQDTRNYFKFTKELTANEIEALGKMIINIDTNRQKTAFVYTDKEKNAPDEIHIILKLEI